MVTLPSTSDHRLAPALTARIVGVVLVVLAVVVFVLTGVVAVAGWPVWLILPIAGAGVLGTVAGAVLASRAYAVRLDADGYRVRFVRGVGVASARWKDVKDVVSTTVDTGAGQTPCVVLRLRDGRSSTIPVEVLATDREAFARELRAFCQRGHGLRPLRP